MQLSVLAFTPFIVAVAAQGTGVIKVPGTGKCPDACITLRNPVTGAAIACCGDEDDGCNDCAPHCTAKCADGSYGACADMGGVEKTCSKGCELSCDGDYTICSIGGAQLDPKPNGCF